MTQEIPLSLAEKLYRTLYRIRRVEETIAEKYPEQEIRCPVHLSIGQEAVATGVCAALEDRDIVFSSHRCHAHYLAKGGDLSKMIAELYGKSAGCSGGKGGSMHLVDVPRGMWGSSAIVGGAIPLAVGVAFANQLQRNRSVAVAFFGDGAAEQGVFYESLNFAALKKIPVLFVCENNFYSTMTPLSERQACDNIYQRGEPFGVPGFRVDGTEVLEVLQSTREAVLRAREGQGPTVIEARVYRWREHVGPNLDYELGYRSESELAAWMKRCPLKKMRAHLVEKIGLDGGMLARWEKTEEEEIQKAWVHARGCMDPVEEDLWKGVL